MRRSRNPAEPQDPLTLLGVQLPPLAPRRHATDLRPNEATYRAILQEMRDASVVRIAARCMRDLVRSSLPEDVRQEFKDLLADHKRELKIVLPHPVSSAARRILEVENDYQLLRSIVATATFLRSLLGVRVDSSVRFTADFLSGFLVITDQVALVEDYHLGTVPTGLQGGEFCNGGLVPLFRYRKMPRGAGAGLSADQAAFPYDLYASYFMYLFDNATGFKTVAGIMGW